MKYEVENALCRLIELNCAPENEAEIRNLCHVILNNQNSSDNDFSQEAEKICLRKLNELERKIITAGENCRPHFRYDLSLIVKNAVCVSEILLSERFVNVPYSPVFMPCSERLITRAVCEEINYLSSLSQSSIYFSLISSPSRVILSARSSCDKQINIYPPPDLFDLLSKIAHIHSGIFLVKITKLSQSLYLSISDTGVSLITRRPQNYFEMLRDKTSVPHIVYSSRL